MAYCWGITQVSGRMVRNGGQKEEKDLEGRPPAAHPEVLLFLLQPCGARGGLQQRRGMALSSCKNIDRSRAGPQAQTCSKPIEAVHKRAHEGGERCDWCTSAMKMRMRDIVRQQSCRILPCPSNPLIQGTVFDAL